MTTYGADTFTRANSTTTLGTAETGGAWTASVGTWGIISNAAYVPIPSTDQHGQATLSVAQNDVTVSCDVGLSPTLNRATAGLVLRYADGSNWMRVLLKKTTAEPDRITLDQLVANSYTLLATVTSAGLVNGNVYNLKAVIAGTTVAVYLDGVSKIAATSFNAALSTQKYGMAMYKGATDYDNGSSYYDNFLVTDNAADLIPRLNPLLNANIYRM